MHAKKGLDDSHEAVAPSPKYPRDEAKLLGLVVIDELHQ